MGTRLAAGAPQHPSSLPPAGLRDLALPTHLCSAERSPALLPLGAVSTALVGGGGRCLSLPLPSKDIGALHCWLCPQIAPTLGSPQKGAESHPRGGDRRVRAGAGTVPSCPHAWLAPCRHFPGQKAECPPRQGTRTTSLPQTARPSQRIRRMHRAPGWLQRGDPVGVQIPGGGGGAGADNMGLRTVQPWLSTAVARCWGWFLPPTADAWDGPWVAPRKLCTQVSGRR